MSEIGDTYKAMNAVRQNEGQRRRELADQQVRDAQALANANGVLLIRHSETHYQLIVGDWIWNVYPGNQRFAADRKHRGPWLEVSESADWTLADVVRAGIKVKP